MSVLIVIACAFLFSSQSADAVKCMQCVEMPHPFDCNIVTECTSSELCYVEQFITSGGLTLYNSGCLSKKRCTAKKRELGPRIAKRQDEQLSKQDLVTCIECCQGEYCNIQGCRQQALSRVDRGPKCFSCPAQLTPEKCRDTLNCDLDEVCAIYKPHPYYNEWSSKCMGKIQCNALVQSQATFIGKRNVVNMKNCPRCCTDDFCNDSCQHNVTSSVTSTTKTNPPTQLPVHQTTSKQSSQTTRHSIAGQTTTPPAAHHGHNVKTTKSQTGKITTTPPSNHGHHQTITTKSHGGQTTTTHSHHGHHQNTTTKTHGGQTTTTHSHHGHHQNNTTKTHGGQTTTTHSHHGHHQNTTTKTHGGHNTPTNGHNAHHQATTTKAHGGQKSTQPSTTPHLMTTPDPSIQCKAQGYIYDTPTRMCLKFVSQKLNWTDAQSACKKDNGRLVVMTSKEKIKDVNDYLANNKQYHGVEYWVGATEVSHVHTFQWTNGKTVVVDDYMKYNLTNTNCLLTSNPKPKTEYDFCRKLKSFICENSDYIRP